MTSMAYVGTGLLGSAFAEAAGKRGERVTVWNRTVEKARALEAFGARVADTPLDAVRGAARVHLVLADDAVVNDVIARFRAGLEPSAIIIDHSTTLPALTAERSLRLNGEGVRYLHCPVFAGPPAARQGLGIMMVSGPASLFDEVKAALQQQVTRVEYLGERPDLAAVYKICGNAFILGLGALVADVFTVGKGAGVPPADVMTLLDYFDPRAIVAGRGKKMAARDYSATFELAMARKDVRLMIETAAGIPLAMLPGLAARMDALLAEGLGHQDLAIIGRDAVPG